MILVSCRACGRDVAIGIKGSIVTDRREAHIGKRHAYWTVCRWCTPRRAPSYARLVSAEGHPEVQVEPARAVLATSIHPSLCQHCGRMAATGIWRLSGNAFGHEWAREEALCAPCGFAATDRRRLVREPRCDQCRDGDEHKHTPRCDLYDTYAARYVKQCVLVRSGMVDVSDAPVLRRDRARAQRMALDKLRQAVEQAEAALARFRRRR